MHSTLDTLDTVDTLDTLAAVSALSSQNANEMWVNKYQPRETRDLVGNKDNIDAIHEWLNKYKKCDPSIKRSLLLTGPPGTGKTSCSRIIAQEHGYKVLEFNASDTRNKKSIESLVKESSTSSNISVLVTGGLNEPHLIVMDEVDGMSHGDRGGMNELITIINPHKTKKRVTNKKRKEQLQNYWGAPIICIANTDHLSKLKNLITQCEVLSFDSITDADLFILASKIRDKEGLIILDDDLRLIVQHAQGDCRRLIHFLQFVSINKTHVTAIEITNAIKYFKRKKMDITITESTEHLLKDQTLTQKEIMQIFYNDRSLIPLMIQENFIRVRFSNKPNSKLFHTINQCEELFSISDVISQVLFMYPTTNLFLDVTGFLTVYFPLYLLRNHSFNMPKSVSYTLYLGNISSYSAQRKILKSIYQFNPMVKDRSKMLFLKHYIFNLLEKDQKDKVIETLYEYELIPSVIDTLLRIKEVGPKWIDKQKLWKKLFNAKFRTKFQKQFEEYEMQMFKLKGTLPISERYDNRLYKTVTWNKDKGCFEPDRLQLESF
jgi:replication factor C subunit 1